MIKNNESINIGLNLTKKDFTMVSNNLLTDSNISFGAKGLLSLMLSRPADWQFFKTELIKNSSDSMHSVTKLIKELEENRYLFKFKKANKGKGAGFTWIWLFKDEPLSDEEIEKIKDFYNLSKIELSNDTVKSTISLINDDSCLGVYNNTNLLNNTDINNNTKHVTCLDLKKSEKKIMLGINPKGYPQKDEWEKFLNENLVGIDYIPAIEKAIKSLLKTETPTSVKKILLETYKTGIETGRSISEIATIVSKGNALRAKNTKSEKKKKVVVGQKKEQEIVKPKIIESTPITDAVLEQKKEHEFLDDKFNRLTKEQQENLLNKASELAKMQSNGLEVFEKMLANGKIKYDLLREINIGGENEKNNF